MRAKLRRDAEVGWRAGLKAVDPYAAVAAALDKDPEPELAPSARRVIVASGKAAAAMLSAAADRLSYHHAYAVLPAGAEPAALPARTESCYGGHPVPTLLGLRGSRDVLEAVSGLGGRDRLLYLLSGGSSSLFEVALPSVRAADLIRAYELLLGCGAPIEDLNLVRRHFSVLKGGGLALAAAPASLRTLALSDVIGDDVAAIGSGPTVYSAPAPGRALDLLGRYGLTDVFPAAMLSLLQRAAHEESSLAASPKKSAHEDAGFAAAAGRAGVEAEARSAAGVVPAAGEYEVVASNAMALTAARACLYEMGYGLFTVRDEPMSGDAGAFAVELAAAIAGRIAAGGRWALVCGGETTVRVSGSAGLGGRNQHMAGAVAVKLDGREGFACMVAGSDGVDGVSEAAGALIDGSSAERARRAAAPLPQAIAAFDSGSALARSGDAFVTGPTATNVGDIVVALTDSGDSGAAAGARLPLGD